MEENILIDPYMFFVEDMADIEIQINFFHNIIALCNANQIRVCLYQGLYEEIQQRELSSFPICTNEIADVKLREEVLILNNSFRKTLANHFTPIDIEQCSGEQEFQLLYGEEQCDAWHQDKRYFELFCVMLTPCYIEERELSNRVLTSECGGSIQANQILEIMCNCEIKTFKKAFEFVLTSVFDNTKEQIYRNIVDYVVIHPDLKCESPETIRGDHHNEIQNKEINSYEDIARKNKRAISVLRNFGLYRIIFKEFHEDASKPESDIAVVGLNKGNKSEIIEGWLYCYTGFKCKVELYFPEEIGNLLCMYCERYFDYKKLESLTSRLGL